MNQSSIDSLLEKGIMRKVTPFRNLYSIKKIGETLIYGRRIGETKYSVLQVVKDEEINK